MNFNQLNHHSKKITIKRRLAVPDHVKSKCRIKICKLGSCIATGQHYQPWHTGKKGENILIFKKSASVKKGKTY
jgi:hypothetical protein